MVYLKFKSKRCLIIIKFFQLCLCMFSTADLLSNLLIRIAYVKLKGINGKIEFKFQFIRIIMFLLTDFNL
jgi:hypothetical protein